MTNDVHTLMRNADNIDTAFCNGTENHIASLLGNQNSRAVFLGIMLTSQKMY